MPTTYKHLNNDKPYTIYHIKNITTRKDEYAHIAKLFLPCIYTKPPDQTTQDITHTLPTTFKFYKYTQHPTSHVGPGIAKNVQNHMRENIW